MLEPHASELAILFADRHLVAIDKPAGLLVHRSRIDLSARTFAMQQLRDQLGQLVFPVHRLDRPTSGVLLFALSAEIARQLADQFAARTVKKKYQAIVRGHLDQSIKWDEPIGEKLDRMTDQRARLDKPPQPAITIVEPIRNWTIPFSTGKYPTSRYALVTAKPLTGRKHQLRRHFNHMAHPIVGDTTYGDRRHNRLFRERLGIGRLLLVARELTFKHPVDKRTLTINAPLGDEFQQAIVQLDRVNQ